MASSKLELVSPFQALFRNWFCQSARPMSLETHPAGYTWPQVKIGFSRMLSPTGMRALAPVSPNNAEVLAPEGREQPHDIDRAWNLLSTWNWTSSTKRDLNSSTEMQEMLLCPSEMLPGERDAFLLPDASSGLHYLALAAHSQVETISLCSWVLFFRSLSFAAMAALDASYHLACTCL